MIRFTEQDGATIFAVRVVPRASRSEIVGEHNGVLRVRLAAAPVAGAANEELISTIARALGVRRSAVEIASGHSSRNKRLRVKGSSPQALERLLGGS